MAVFGKVFFLGKAYQSKVSISSYYYPFGMIQPGRKYSAGPDYRYGFNGKEKDNSLGPDYHDYDARIFDARVGRWLSMDPLTIKYPMLTPYHYGANNPILFVDNDGEDLYVYGDVKEWNKFKAFLEKSFYGMVILKRDEKTKKVTMEFDQKRVDMFNAMTGGGGGNNLKLGISASEPYKVLKDAISPNLKKRHTKIKLAETPEERKKALIGAFRGGDLNGTRQLIDIDDVEKIASSKAMSPLASVIHEIKEGYEDQVVEGHPNVANKQEFDALYEKVHKRGLESQRKTDGLDEIHANLRSYENVNYGALNLEEIAGKKKDGRMEYILSYIFPDTSGGIAEIMNFRINNVVKDSSNNITSYNVITPQIK
jgi:RHS repeat-associated protein